MLQEWKHKAADWEALRISQQKRIMRRTKGRTKLNSIELGNKPSDSRVARTDQDEFGNIFRRNMPYASADNHGTMFVGLRAEQRRLCRMLQARCADTLYPAVD